MKIKLNIMSFFVSSLYLTGAAAAQDGGIDADALAKELANPGGALSSMINKLEIRTYDGTLPGADKQHSYNYVFQPVLPFPTDSGDTVIFRPAFTFLGHQPYFDAGRFEFDQATALGDTGFDLLYSFGNINPFVFGLGAVGGIPTGTDSRITGSNWLLGPEMLAAKQFDWGIVGFLAFHQWKVAGNGSDVNVSSLQPIAAYSLGNGVTIGPSGTITYNWNAASSSDAWTVPIGINIGKATTLNGKPVKYAISAEYNVVRPDAFTPDWKITFSIIPVVQNPFLN